MWSLPKRLFEKSGLTKMGRQRVTISKMLIGYLPILVSLRESFSSWLLCFGKPLKAM